MAHKTLIGGTNYNITSGKSLIDGTIYNISKGRTLVRGTGYDIRFTPPIPQCYSMLYSDGDMIFQLGNTSNNDKVLINEYTNFINETYTNYNNVLWYTRRNNIINVSFKDEISPKNMSYWFYNAINMKSINYTNLNINSITNMYYTYYNCQNLTGSPVCGNNVTNMSRSYYYCQNLTGSPVCGEKVTNMAYTYYNCKNLTGSPVCGNNITNMYSTYNNCINLTGSPVCGNNITNMSSAYEYCYNLTGSPVCGNNVTNMAYTYNNCKNLTGSPVCGDNVTDMTYAYYNCINLTGSPVCGEKVTTLACAYLSCRNITGSPVCGNNVTNMSRAYECCYNLTGSPACGENVTSMYSTYRECTKMTGSPVCGENVTSMSRAYETCYNLTGSPVCGNNVTNMSSAYYSCSRITGSPVCGEKVTNMSNAYFRCSNLTGSPVCGDNVTNMVNTYSNCYNLTGSPVCGNKVIDMSYAYYYCRNLTGSMYCHNENIVSFHNCFYGRNNYNRINVYVPINSTTNKSILVSDSNSIIGNSITWTSNVSNKCYYNTSYNVYVYPILGFNIDIIPSIYMSYLSTQSISFNYSYEMDNTLPTFTITSDDTSIAAVSDIVIEGKTVNFNITSYNLDGNAEITVFGEITSSEGITFTKTVNFKVGVNEDGIEPTILYEVESVDGATYGFELNDNGYYESQNAGIGDSYSLCKIVLTCDGTSNLYLDCINSAESGYDYGILSNIDQTLSLSTSDSNYYKKFTSSSTSIQTVNYGVLEAGEHFIYVKYRKDGSVNSGNDSLQFQVRFE